MKNSRAIKYLLGVLITGVLVTQVAKKKEDQKEARNESATFLRDAPYFELKDSHGNLHRLSDWGQAKVVLHFWASWCPPCLAEISQWLDLSRGFHRNLSRREFPQNKFQSKLKIGSGKYRINSSGQFSSQLSHPMDHQIDQGKGMNNLHETQIGERGSNPSQDIVWVAVSLDQDWEAAQGVLPEAQMPPHVISLLDPEGKVPEAYGTFQYPETYLLGPEKNATLKILHKWVGPQSWNVVEFKKWLLYF